jgi:hypothetical protein
MFTYFRLVFVLYVLLLFIVVLISFLKCMCLVSIRYFKLITINKIQTFRVILFYRS